MKHDYTGLWVSADHEIRQALLPNGRYVEAHGHLEAVAEGSYRIDGNHIELIDDDGSVVAGDFIEGVLHLDTTVVMYAAF